MPPTVPHPAAPVRTSPTGTSRRSTRTLAGAAAISLACAAGPVLATGSPAQASPTPSAPPSTSPTTATAAQAVPASGSPAALAAPAQKATPGERRVAVPASSGSVTVGATAQPLIAHLAVPATFDLAGLTWSSLTGHPTLQLRARTSAGWGAWTDAGADGEGNGAGGSSAIYTGAATAIEVRVFGPAGSGAKNLHVSLIDSSTTAADQNLAKVATSAAASRRNATMATGQGYTYATMPTLITRAQWGADESLRAVNGASCTKPSYDQTVEAAVVHHTDGTNTYTRAQAPAIMRAIYAFHVKDRGWCDVGYNFLVDKYGDIFEGRYGAMDLPLHGAHATLWNTNTVGISVMMNSMSTDISTAARNSLTRLIAWKLAGNYVDPNATVYMVNGTYPTILRHGDVMDTSCPGAHITADMPSIRAQVTQLMGNWHTPIQQAWAAQGGAKGALGLPHQLEEAYAGGRLTVFARGAVLQLPNSTDTRSMDAVLWNRYSALGGASSLGFPSSNQVAGTRTGTSIVDLPGGRSLVEDSQGAWLTTAAIKAAFWNTPAVQNRLGAPIADAVVTASGSSQLFERGRIEVTGTTVGITYDTAWGDQNLDRVADLATVPAGTSALAFRITAHGAAGGTLAGPTLDTTTNWVAQVPDVTGDGLGELLTRRADGTLWFQRGLGNGRFDTAHQVGHGWAALRELTVTQPMTGNGRPDLLAIDGSGQLVRYVITPTGALATRAVLATGWQSVVHMGTAGDHDGDGSIDVLTTDAAGALTLHAGTTTGTLTGSARVIGHGWGPVTRIWSSGDVTGDGRPDLLADWSNGPVRVYSPGRLTLARQTDYLPSTTGLTLFG